MNKTPVPKGAGVFVRVVDLRRLIRNATTYNLNIFPIPTHSLWRSWNYWSWSVNLVHCLRFVHP